MILNIIVIQPLHLWQISQHPFSGQSNVMFPIQHFLRDRFFSSSSSCDCRLVRFQTGV